MVKSRPHPSRRLPVGAEFISESKATHFRVWAPEKKSVNVDFEDHRPAVALSPEENGYFSGLAPDVLAGTCYKYVLEKKEDPYPDPVSRFQPRGVHHFSQVIDPDAFSWTDATGPAAGSKGRFYTNSTLGPLRAKEPGVQPRKSSIICATPASP